MLLIAARLGLKSVVQLLVKLGADIHFRDAMGWSALTKASLRGSPRVAEFLLDQGADANQASIHGNTPLMAAVYGGDLRTVEVLLHRGANVNSEDLRGRTALFIAAGTGRAKVAEELLKQGADVTVKAQNGWTALVAALKGRHFHVAQILADKGYDPIGPDSLKNVGIRPSRYDDHSALIAALEDDDLQVAERLVWLGLNARVRDSFGRTPLMMAADKGALRLAGRLIDRGADVNATDRIGRTALMIAADRGHGEIVKLLLDRGASVDARDSVGRTALTMAEISGHRAVAGLLREKPAEWDNHNDPLRGLFDCAGCPHGEIEITAVGKIPHQMTSGSRGGFQTRTYGDESDNYSTDGYKTADAPPRPDSLLREKSETESPRLSVIVPTFNREKILDKCLRSLVAQQADGVPFEIVVVDNNSTDGTENLVETYCKTHGHFVYAKEENQGLNNARNRGYKASRGEYLAYLDDDVILPPTYLSNVYDVIRKHQPDLLSGPIYPYYTDAKPGWFEDEIEIRQSADVSGFSTTCRTSGGNLIIKRSILESLGAFDPAIGMRGTKLGFGGEAKVLDTYREVTPADQQRVYYSLDCWVLHHSPAHKMRLWYIFKRQYLLGAAKAEILIPRRKRTWRRFGREFRGRLVPLLRLMRPYIAGKRARRRLGKRTVELTKRAGYLAGITKGFLRSLLIPGKR